MTLFDYEKDNILDYSVDPTKELKDFIPLHEYKTAASILKNKETLKKLAELTDEDDNPIYPFCSYLQKFREAEGVRKIVDKFPEHVSKDGFVFSHVMQYGTTILSKDDVMEGVPDMIHTVQVECTFPDGTKLVTVHNPIQ